MIQAPSIYRHIQFSVLAAMAILLLTGFSGPRDKKSPEEKRQEIQAMKNEALNELYKLEPGAKSEIANAKGYAVFGSTGVNVLLLSTGRGGGVARDNNTGKVTYMKMFSGGFGVGVGVKKYFAIFIFSTSEAYTKFIEKGWEAETQADGAAKTEKKGGAGSAAMSISPYIKLYQVTDKGFAAQATIQGTKYKVDKDLN
jgi:lipid-binding SYLF domain-containing protein